MSDTDRETILAKTWEWLNRFEEHHLERNAAVPSPITLNSPHGSWRLEYTQSEPRETKPYPVKFVIPKAEAEAMEVFEVLHTLDTMRKLDTLRKLSRSCWPHKLDKREGEEQA